MAIGIREYLAKARKVGQPAGRAEGAPSVKPVRHGHAGNKVRPNSAGQKTLKQPSFGQVAGGNGGKGMGSLGGLMKPHEMLQQMMGKEFEPKLFKAGALVKFNMPLHKIKGQGKIVSTGAKGIRVLSETGQYLNLLWREVDGLVPPPKEPQGNKSKSKPKGNK